MIEENKRLVIKFDTIKYFLLFLHFISITAYQLGEGYIFFVNWWISYFVKKNNNKKMF